MPLLKYIISLLYHLDDLELSCYMSWIINSLHFYKDHREIEEELVEFLIEKTKKNLNLCNQLFWTITQNMSQGESRDYFKLMRARLVNKLEPHWYKIFQTGYDFTTNIIKIAQKDIYILYISNRSSSHFMR